VSGAVVVPTLSISPPGVIVNSGVELDVISTAEEAAGALFINALSRARVKRKSKNPT
jgi:hypothetical protein